MHGGRQDRVPYYQKAVVTVVTVVTLLVFARNQSSLTRPAPVTTSFGPNEHNYEGKTTPVTTVTTVTTVFFGLRMTENDRDPNYKKQSSPSSLSSLCLFLQETSRH